MKTKRLLFAGSAVAILAAITIAVWLRPAAEPTYRGKPLSEWFKAYGGTPGQALPTPTPLRWYPFTNPPTWINATNHGKFMVISNRLGWFVITNQPVAPTPFSRPREDEAWTAIRTIGSNAVPFLAEKIRPDRWEKLYERNFTNLPPLLQKRLPHPAQRWLMRMRAIDIASRLGPAAHETAPALLKLLYETDPRTLGPVMSALRSVRAERVDVAEVILRLGTEKRFREVLQVGTEMGWKDREVARLLGKILAGPDTLLHRDAIRMLEASGVRALPAAEAIIQALKHPDSEVRYLAARSLEQIAREIAPAERPELEAKLRVAALDQSVIVSNVSRRVLLRLQGVDVPAPYRP